MDTSKEYIKMCEKSIKIQDKWSPDYGDYIYHKNYKNPQVLTHMRFLKDGLYIILTQGAEEYFQNLIWLPRQDQLQGMVFDYINHSCIYYIHKFKNWIIEEKSLENHEAQNYSMEQLWLAFVMKEQYNKTWNGEDWIKEK